MTVLVPARLRPRDVIRVGGAGLRARPLRVFLSALGIAIGIAAMLGVVGISASSQEDLNRQLAALGTNLLTVSPGNTLFGEASHLPAEAEGMIGQIAPVTAVTATGTTKAKVYRNDHVPEAETGSISVTAARLDLIEDVGAGLASGTWLNEATHGYPATVLGTKAADRLGVVHAGPDQRVWLGGQWFTVVGVLAPPRSRPSSTRPPWSAGPPRRNGWASTGTRPPSTPGPRRRTSSRYAACSPPPPTPSSPTRSRSPAPPTCWPPSRPPTPP
ncbi:ABC transporter permease [Nonomuraea rubra]|uniref:ABC transporter permease n=1 Tax=Nonomuraea rubra TaxID=46180 RepID=UPI0036111924